MSKYCDFSHPLDEDPRFRKCPTCGAIAIENHYHPCGEVPDFDIRNFPEFVTGKFVAPSAYGPGAELMQMFSSWGLPPCQLCHATARKMNALGVDGCREQLEELTDEIVSNSERHPKLAEALSQETAKLKLVNVAPKWLKIIGVRRFIVQAIDRAEKTAAELSAQKKPPVKAAP